jgi:hypothetical protein
VQSKFEFKLRLQEFIELVRAERMMDAIMYARKYLSVWSSTNMKELQTVLAIRLPSRPTSSSLMQILILFFARTESCVRNLEHHLDLADRRDTHLGCSYMVKKIMLWLRL